MKNNRMDSDTPLVSVRRNGFVIESLKQILSYCETVEEYGFGYPIEKENFDNVKLLIEELYGSEEEFKSYVENIDEDYETFLKELNWCIHT